MAAHINEKDKNINRGTQEVWGHDMKEKEVVPTVLSFPLKTFAELFICLGIESGV